MAEPIPFSDGVTVDRRSHRETHLQEQVTSPQRLAEIVLNTVNVIFDRTLFHVDRRSIDELMQQPPDTWNSISVISAKAAKNAKSLLPQIETVDKALQLIEIHGEKLPVVQFGDPPKTIINPRGAEQLLEDSNIARHRKERESVRSSTDKETLLKDKQKREEGREKEIYADPVRRLARLIKRFQEDAIVQKLGGVITGEGLLRTMIEKNGYDASLKPFIEELAVEMSEAQRYAFYSRKALQQYALGNLPDEDTVRRITVRRSTHAGGTIDLVNYLKTFAEPEITASK